MAPARSHARVWQGAPSRLFSRLWRTRSRARCSSDNAGALRSDSTAIFSRSTAIPMADGQAHRDHASVP